MKKTNSLLLLMTSIFLVGCSGGGNTSSSSSSTKSQSSSIPSINLLNINFQSDPKTSYKFNEKFDYPTIIAAFSDGSSSDVTENVIWDGDYTNKAGTHLVMASYSYGSETKTLEYSVEIGDPQSKLKFAIFADVQLTGKEDIAGKSVTNQGATANAPIALKNHLQFIKNQGINVVLMNGDVTNQANEYYYSYFNEILQEVYGKDESKYPEFVWNMGNHEWWGGVTETDCAEAVRLFKQNARINSANLVKESKVKYALDSSSTLPSYYKVINGVPFMVISGINSTGEVSSELYNELASWLSEIKQLESVKLGGPIFVEYHCALSTSMTHGQGSNSKWCDKVETLFEDTPNAVIFTGDTHFPGNNERSINQVNFTTINLGSSSYSRMVNESAVICDDYYNVGGGSATSKADKMMGNLKFKEAYTPTIQIVDVFENDTFKIDRYFSSDNGAATKIGKTWRFDMITSKDDFTYTNDRFQNVKVAQELYGADGLSWESEDKVTFGVNENNQMTVRFPDVKDYHYCEHYLIEVNGEPYDVCSNYYKYLSQKELNYFVLDVNEASNYNVKVTAYDFYDNPSLNTLTSSTNDILQAINPLEVQYALTYSDIQIRNNITQCAPNSNASIEYFYQGKYQYKWGAILGRLIQRDQASSTDCRNQISIKESQTNVAPIIKLKAKNLNNSDMTFGITVVDKDGSWKTDFGAEYQKKVSPGNWSELSWNLYDIFKFTSVLDIRQLCIKAKLDNASTDGYSMNFLIDDLDVIGEPIVAPEKGQAFTPGNDYIKDLKKSIPVSTGSVSVDIKFSSSSDTYVNVMFGDGWKNYFGYFELSSSTIAGAYNGLTSVTTLEDGYIRYTFKLSQITKEVKDADAPKDHPENINLFYIRGGWTTASGYVYFVE